MQRRLYPQASTPDVPPSPDEDDAEDDDEETEIDDFAEDINEPGAEE